MANDMPLGNGREQRLLSQTWFATPVVWCRAVDLSTADCGQVCRAVDGCDYVIKDGHSGDSVPIVPHCEWFCTELAELVHIASPPHKIIKISETMTAFGSRWEGGVKAASATGNWWERHLDPAEYGNVLSHIYAFDQFVANVDRHANNFLERDQFFGFTLIANDYSRAWLRHGFPLPPAPLGPCNTVSCQRWLTQYWRKQYVTSEAVDALLERLSQVSVASVQRIIEEHPKEWLPDELKDRILNWWVSQDMLARLEAISAGVKNATAL